MIKELIFVYDWIGTQGPLNNHKLPDIYDLMKRTLYTSWENVTMTNEHDPIVMELKKYVPCKIVPSCEVESLKDKKFLYEIQLTPRNDYLTVTLSEGIGVLDATPVSQTVLNEIRTGNGYLLLTTKFESFLDNNSLRKIHDYFNRHQIPLNKIIYVTNSANAKEIYNLWCEKHNITERINCEYIGLYLLDQKNIANRSEFIEYRVSDEKEKLFLNFNRRHRLHRYMFLLKLKEKKLLDKFFISFSNENSLEHWLHDTKNICRTYDINVSSLELVDLYNSLPMVLDSDKFYRFPVEDDIVDTTEWYSKTYISLVSETNFENNVVHMTEKTVKPILFKQPFIMIGPPKTLHYLKQLKFKTFSDYWDESYDNEYDPKIRMEKIIDVCQKIASWDEKTLKKFLFDTKPIVDYNFRNLANLKQDDLNQFVQTYGSEIRG